MRNKPCVYITGSIITRKRPQKVKVKFLKKFMKDNKYLLLSISSVLVVLFVWYLCVDVLQVTYQSVFPGPIKCFQTLIKKLYTSSPDGATLLQNLLASLEVAMLGYVLGAVVGIPLGIMMAWNKWVDRFVRPLFDLIRPIPGIAWIPLFLVMFGIGITSKAMVIFLNSMIACTVNAYSGIQQTSELHLWVGDVFGASDRQKLFKIAIPTATPMIFTGLRVALGTSWTALIAAELLASNKGLGYMIQNGSAICRPDIIIVGMLTIGVVGLIFDVLLHRVEIRVTKGMNAE